MLFAKKTLLLLTDISFVLVNKRNEIDRIIKRDRK